MSENLSKAFSTIVALAKLSALDENPLSEYKESTTPNTQFQSTCVSNWCMKFCLLFMNLLRMLPPLLW